ncbi:hypothetical protein BH23VER1_BH23VER1_25070 [soil metagenome]
MSVPLLDLQAQNLPLERELNDAFNRVLRSGQFILGREVTEFEEEVARFVGCGHAIGVSSGTDAILVALMALGIGPGDEVICPSFTFFATAGCVARVGATPVFADSCPVCFNVDVESAAAKITPRTKALIPVHLFGQSAEMDGIMALAKEHHLAVVEDAAQSLGATYRGAGSGTIGDCGTFSFFPSKNLGGLGDGGMVVTNDGDLAERIRILRMHGSKPKYYHQAIGGNFRLDALQAALLRVKLPHYSAYTDARRANAAAYTEALSQITGAAVTAPSACGCPPAPAEATAIVLPAAHTQNAHIWNQFTVRVIGEGRRDALRAHLGECGIGSEIYYPVPMHQQACFADQPAASLSDCPVAERLASECLSIPVYPGVSAAQRDEVVAAIANFLGQPAPPARHVGTAGAAADSEPASVAPPAAGARERERPGGGEGTGGGPRKVARRVAGWLADSPLLRRGKSHWEKNRDSYTYPLSKVGKLETGMYVILNDFAADQFPPTFHDQRAAYDAEINYAKSLPGWDGQKVLAAARRKPFWFGEIGFGYLKGFSRTLKILDSCGFRPPSSLVEVGCGAGWMAEFLASYGFRMLATTIAPVDVQEAQRRIQALAARDFDFDLRYAVSTMEELAECPALPEVTDGIIVYEAMHHAYDWKRFVEAASEILRPGGWLFIMNEPNLTHTAVSYRVAKLAGTHEIGFRPGEVMSQLKACGFGEVRSFFPRWHSFVAPLWIAARKDGAPASA